MIVYLATYNSDLTEGKGFPIVKAVFSKEDDAVASVMAEGVMGVGTGDVYAAEVQEHPIIVRGSALNADTYAFHPKNKVWGYRKNWKGQWDCGWIDLRDAPTEDPEYVEYLRLKGKFEK